MFPKRILLSLVLVISVFVFLTYPLQASAILGLPSWDDVLEGGTRILVGAITIIPAYIFFGVAALTNWLIGTVANIGVAPCAAGPTCSTPAFVTNGWTFSRNLVNMSFLLILVFIGLATILRLREYELQRTLPRLIVIALLVNFSGLLVGFFADVGNIATLFFTKAVGSLGSPAFSTVFALADAQIDSIFTTSGSLTASFAGSLALAGALVFFFLFAIVAYFAIALVFFLRLVILWVLVIVAPFAFAAYILPATRGWWTRWINTLTQWAFITVPLAFFMFLANFVLNNPIAALSAGPPTSGAVSGWGAVLGAMLSPFVAIILLITGLGMSAGMSSSFTRVRRWAGKATAVGAGVLGRDLIRDKWLARSAKAQSLASKMENFTSRDRGIMGKTVGRVSAPLLRYTGRKMGSDAQVGIKEAIKKAEDEAKDWSPEKVDSMLKGNISREKKIGYLNAKIKSQEIDDVMTAGTSERQVRDIYHAARQTGDHRDLQAAFPHFVQESELRQMKAARDLKKQPNQVTAAEATLVTPDEVIQERDRLFRRMKPERAKQMSGNVFSENPAAPGTLLHEDEVNQVIRNFSGARIANVASTDQAQEVIPVLENQIKKGFTTSQTAVAAGTFTYPATPPPPTDALTWLAYQPPAGTPIAQARLMGGNNPGLARWIRTQAGQQLGFTL